jgi:hypothetical protein
VPYFHAVKLLLLVWLQSESYEGAQRLYYELLRPCLAQWQPLLDEFLAGLLQALVRNVPTTKCLQTRSPNQCCKAKPSVPAVLQRRPELQMLGEGLHGFAARTPLLEWFVRSPDGRRRQRRSVFITDVSDDSRAAGTRRR